MSLMPSIAHTSLAEYARRSEGSLPEASLIVVSMVQATVLRVSFATADNVMHPPPSPIFNSGNYAIIGFFLALILLTLVAAYFLTRLFLDLNKTSA